MTSPAAPTYGPVMLGVIFNVFLYGIMVTQTFLYFTTYKHDRTWVKLFVCFLLLCDTVNCALDIASLYIPLVNEYGNIEVLQTGTWLIAQDPAMTAIIAFCVQAFFSWRVKVLIGNVLLFSVIAICCITQLWIVISVEIVKVHLLAGENKKFGKVSIVWLTMCAIADVLIAGSLVLWLKRQKTHSEFSKTDELLDRISRLTIQTGMLTAMCAITSLVLFLASPPHMPGAHLMVNYPLSKLYSNSLMSSLNARAYWGFGDAVSRDPRAEASRAVAGWSARHRLSFRRPAHDAITSGDLGIEDDIDVSHTRDSGMPHDEKKAHISTEPESVVASALDVDSRVGPATVSTVPYENSNCPCETSSFV